ncbi:MAG TPA: sugar ABC transporter ATP-binding protein [Gaiella sp.]
MATDGAFLRVSGLHKRFGGVHALRGAELAVRGGEVHSLVGANGSGKSTLLNILSGQVEPDAGTIVLDGEPVRFRDPSRALAHGIATVTQETTLVPELSVAENILLGPRKVRRWYGIDWRASRRRAAEIKELLGAEFSVRDQVSDLPADQRQLVEIARAISMNARVLLLDEPTSSLTETEVESLFDLVRSLKARGMTTIFVSHRMSELFALADRVTILRDGRTVETGEIGAYDPDRIIERMVGAAPAPATAHTSAAEEREPALRVHGLSVPGHVHDATLTVAAGEAVGIAGLTGSGRTELLEAIFGMRRPSAGRTEVGGAELRHGHVAHAIEHGLAYVPGDRKSQGLVLSMSVSENLMMATTSRRMRLRVPSRSRERAEARTVAATFGIVAPSTEAACRTLSGGNQQKVVIAKWMRGSPAVLLMDEPTRGVDVGAKREIYRLLADARERGVGILVSSSETEELLLLCDRILVMARGRIVASLDRAHATEANLAHYSMGAS